MCEREMGGEGRGWPVKKCWLTAAVKTFKKLKTTETFPSSFSSSRSTFASTLFLFFSFFFLIYILVAFSCQRFWSLFEGNRSHLKKRQTAPIETRNHRIDWRATRQRSIRSINQPMNQWIHQRIKRNECALIRLLCLLLNNVVPVRIGQQLLTVHSILQSIGWQFPNRIGLLTFEFQ